MSAISLSENASVRIVELPKSDRKVQTPEDKKPVALTGKATDEIEGIKALETMFKSAVVAYARKFSTLREAIETCKAAGVTDGQMRDWATEVGYSIQTFANVMTNIRKDKGEMLKVVQKDDRRIARNKKTPAETSLFDRAHDYLLRECGTLAAARKLALALARQFEKEIKESNKSAK